MQELPLLAIELGDDLPRARAPGASLAVSELLLDALRGLDLGWPPADFDVEAEKKRLAAT